MENPDTLSKYPRVVKVFGDGDFSGVGIPKELLKDMTPESEKIIIASLIQRGVNSFEKDKVSEERWKAECAEEMVRFKARAKENVLNYINNHPILKEWPKTIVIQYLQLSKSHLLEYVDVNALLKEMAESK